MDNSLTDGVYISQSSSGSLEREEPHQIYNLKIDVKQGRGFCSSYLGKLGHIGDASLDLGEEGGDLLKLLEPEQSVAGGVLIQDEVRSHDADT